MVYGLKDRWYIVLPLHQELYPIRDTRDSSEFRIAADSFIVISIHWGSSVFHLGYRFKVWKSWLFIIRWIKPFSIMAIPHSWIWTRISANKRYYYVYYSLSVSFDDTLWVWPHYWADLTFSASTHLPFIEYCYVDSFVELSLGFYRHSHITSIDPANDDPVNSRRWHRCHVSQLAGFLKTRITSEQTMYFF